MVSSITSATTAATTTSATSTATASATSTGGDFETFLKMLTTQIQNQDPLNPMESTEFAVQLATFSGVEQQARTNSLLTEMLQGSAGSQLGQLSNWIGKEVRTTSPVWVDDKPVTLQIEPTAGADAVNLVVLDDKGREVAREDIGTGSGEVDWQGLDADGQPLAEGLYQFRIESMKAGAVIGTSDVAAYSEVTGAEMTTAGSVLVLAGNNAVSMDDVTALRE